MSDIDVIEDLFAQHEVAFEYTASSLATQAWDSPDPPGATQTSTDLTGASSQESVHPKPSVSPLPSLSRREVHTVPTSLEQRLNAIWRMFQLACCYIIPNFVVWANQNVSGIPSRITQCTVPYCMGDNASSSPLLCRSEELYPEIRRQLAKPRTMMGDSQIPPLAQWHPTAGEV